MNFSITYRHSRGNLHIQATGLFDGAAAEELLTLFTREYPKGGRVFVDTRTLQGIHESGRAFLAEGLASTPVPASSLFFMGEQGFSIAPNGSRVLTFKDQHSEARYAAGQEKHTCCGKCSHCRCRHGQHSEEKLAV